MTFGGQLPVRLHLQWSRYAVAPRKATHASFSMSWEYSLCAYSKPLLHNVCWV